VDFKRTNLTIELDKFGDPKEYIYYKGSETITFKSHEIIHFKINKVADSFWGIGVIEPLYDIIKIKKNIELGLGEALWRIGFPWVVIKIGDDQNEPSQAQLNEEASNFADVSTRNGLVIPYFYDIQFIESRTLENAGRYFDYYCGQIIAGTAVPRSILMGIGDDSNRSTARAQQENFAITISSLQSLIAEKLQGKVFSQLTTSPADLVFEEVIADEPLDRSRRDEIDVGVGIKTIEEVRKERGLGPKSSDDEPEEEPVPVIGPEEEPDGDPEEEPGEDGSSEDSEFTDISKINKAFAQDLDNFFGNLKSEFFSKIELFNDEKAMEQLDEDPIGFVNDNFNFDHMALFKKIYQYYSLSFIKGAQEACKEMGEAYHVPNDKDISIIQMHCLNIARKNINTILEKVQYAIINNRLADGKLDDLKHDIDSIFVKYGGVGPGNSNTMMNLISDTESKRGLNRGKLWAYKVHGKNLVKVIAKKSEMQCKDCMKYINKIFKIGDVMKLLPIHPHCGCEFKLV
jgi:hypothetical protein